METRSSIFLALNRLRVSERGADLIQIRYCFACLGLVGQFFFLEQPRENLCFLPGKDNGPGKWKSYILATLIALQGNNVPIREGAESNLTIIGAKCRSAD